MSSDLAAPAYDPELALVLDQVHALGLPTTITPDMIVSNREFASNLTPPVDGLLEEFQVERRDVTIGGYQGGEIEVTVLTPKDHRPDGPGIYHIHGGGMISGDRFTAINLILPWVREYDAVCVTVEYRLAPEHPDPVLVEDSYAGLVWMADHAAELGFDPGKILVTGASAGGGLTAGVTLLARDRKAPSLIGSLLVYPMLDDRNDSVSARQYVDTGVWTRGSNQTEWDALLGDRRGTDRVSIYAAPARATDLGGLPPTFIDCGSAEVFRDEDIAYASQIWKDGGDCELHVWPGGYHGFDLLAAETTLAKAMIATRDAWVRRLFTKAGVVASG